MNILIINGPNLNTLGMREPEVYGTTTLEEIERSIKVHALDRGAEVEFFQSNSEGAIIDCLQTEAEDASGIIINPAAYTHTSVAILDALKACQIPVIELHLTNPYARERFRRRSLISPVATGVICGFGAYGCELALTTMANLVKG